MTAAKKFKCPRVLVQHGRCIELVVDIGNDEIAKFRWPKTKKGAMWLFTDAPGKRLIICTYNKVAVTDDDFETRLDSLGPASSRAIEQWTESTGKAADIGSIVKVPERKISRIGRCVSVTYYFDEKFSDGSPREHVFGKPPVVKSSHPDDPSLIVISGADLIVTRAGIEG